MAVTEPFRETVRTMLRDRLFDAAAELFAHDGWRRLTMARIADRAGVSRQTVYNEFGGKQQLAELLVLRELENFLDIVRREFEPEAEFVPAVRAAVAAALTAARDNALLRAVLEGGHSGDNELLSSIVASRTLIDRATQFLATLVHERHPELEALGDKALLGALESVVRLVLSHVTVPTASPQETADILAGLVGAVLAGSPARPAR